MKRTICAVSEGYGCTEAGSIGSNGTRKFDCQVHLEDVPELNYFVKDGKGLLWVHTSRVAAGYYREAEKTNESFRDIFNDGRVWFNTGDIVQYDKRLETLRVIGE